MGSWRHVIDGRRRLVSTITPLNNLLNFDDGPSVMNGALQAALKHSLSPSSNPLRDVVGA